MIREIFGKEKMKKAFTTIELIVAVSLLAVVMVISGMVFKIAIDAQRQAGAIAEITRNFRAITDQLNRDFQGLVKDGILVLRSEEKTVYIDKEDEDTDNASGTTALKINVRTDGLYYISTGDFQSVQTPKNKSNVSLIYLGLYDKAIGGTEPYCSKWIAARRVIELLPDANSSPSSTDDYDDKSLAEYIATANNIITDPNGLANKMKAGFAVDPALANSNWQYFSGGIGNFKIEWAVPSFDGRDNLEWIGYDLPLSDPNNNILNKAGYTSHIDEVKSTEYRLTWEPKDKDYLPKAIKFTMTLYDSRGVIKEGKTFTYIVYIGD